MKPNVRTLLFGEAHECTSVFETLQSVQLLPDYHHECRHVNDMEEFDKILADWMPTLVIVLADGAAGMESVYRSRRRRPELPVFWFSNDQEFGMQSYRMECAYFSTKPVTAEKISHAVRRCNHVGICLTSC